METTGLNYYMLLEVRFDSSIDDISRQYHRLINDVYQNPMYSDDKIKQFRISALNEAYVVLTDPVKRREYDRSFIPATVPNNIPAGNFNPTAYHEPYHNTYRTWYGGMTNRNNKYFIAIVVFMAIRVFYYIYQAAEQPQYYKTPSVYQGNPQTNDNNAEVVDKDAMAKDIKLLNGAYHDCSPIVNQVVKEGNKIISKANSSHSLYPLEEIKQLNADIANLRIAKDNLETDINGMNQSQNDDEIQSYISDAVTQIDQLKYYLGSTKNDMKKLYRFDETITVPIASTMDNIKFQLC